MVKQERIVQMASDWAQTAFLDPSWRPRVWRARRSQELSLNSHHIVRPYLVAKSWRSLMCCRKVTTKVRTMSRLLIAICSGSARDGFVIVNQNYSGWIIRLLLKNTQRLDVNVQVG
jgi:hypothetical protein